jgi:hypothetical protein
MFARLISHQPAVIFSQNKSATSNQPTVLFSQNKSAPAISHQPNEQVGFEVGLFVVNYKLPLAYLWSIFMVIINIYTYCSMGCWIIYVRAQVVRVFGQSIYCFLHCM